MLLAGWGGDGFRDISPCLQYITDLYVIGHQDCNERLRSPRWHNVELTCVQYRESSHKVGCEGDIGSPLVFQNMLVGLLGAANASQCGHDIPDVFINVFLHLPWISDVLAKGETIERALKAVRDNPY